MDFKEEEDQLFTRIVNLKNGVDSPTGEVGEEQLNKKVSAAVGVSLWLITNGSSIQTLADFRNKLDSFKSVLSHPLYIEMEGNLCVCSTINGYLSGLKTEEELLSVMSLLEYDENLSREELAAISRQRYGQAKESFSELYADDSVKKDAEVCQFSMNFKFTDDYKDADKLFSSVSTFYDVADELEEIYTKKKNAEDQKKNNGANNNTVLK